MMRVIATEDMAQAAARLNYASDELSKVIASVNTTLKSMNFGIECWYEFQSTDPVETYYLGYAKVEGKWGVSLRSGEYDEEWQFENAPRMLRVQAVVYLPQLLDGLVRQANSTADLIEKRSAELRKWSIELTDGGETKGEGTT